ncbi:MAG: sulfite exporter TauE/SafE family protein [bacterium]
MSTELGYLLVTAASIGLVHTVLGPDHYLPFVAMAQARSWSRVKTIWITVLCGIGHVLGSVVLGLIGVAAGIAVGSLESLESVRGDLAGWALTAFGLAYLIWGIRRAMKHKVHRHLPGDMAHPDGDGHHHDERPVRTITPWVLFTIFVLGPCEPLIPILMYPAAQKSTLGMILVASVFGVVTITTMVTVVLFLVSGVRLLPVAKLERFSHALAGFVILMCGVAIQAGL